MPQQRIAGRARAFNPAQSYRLSGSSFGRLLASLRRVLFARRARDGRIALGAKGERLAVRRLRREGYRIAARNFRAAGAEIDIIAMDGDTLVFVEVKTRIGLGAGRPEESVHALKQHRIRRAAAIFARFRAMEEYLMRFDVVSVSRPQRRWSIEIIKDAF